VNLLFDLDGTLTDPREGIVACIEHALVVLGESVPTPVELEAFIGPPLRDAFRTLMPGSTDERIEAAIAEYRERFVERGMFENTVYDGIPAALQRLSTRGARLYVATSKPRVFAERILEHFGLARYFDAVYGSELDGRLSDKAELIAHALATSTLTACDSVMIGDRRHDVIGALRNGVVAAGVLWGYGSEHELRVAGAQALLSVPSDVERLL